MFKEIEKIFEEVKSTFTIFGDLRTRKDFEKKLLLQYGDNAANVYMKDRIFFEEQLRILVKAKNHGPISKEDFDVLDNKAKVLLPEEYKR